MICLTYITKDTVTITVTVIIIIIIVVLVRIADTFAVVIREANGSFSLTPVPSSRNGVILLDS